MSTITVKDGTTIYYKDWGKGPGCSSRHVFDSQGSSQCSVARSLQGGGSTSGLVTSLREWFKHLIRTQIRPAA